MLKYALVFTFLALLAGAFGFGLVAGVAWTIAKVLFFVFLVVAILLFAAGSFIWNKVT